MWPSSGLTDLKESHTSSSVFLVSCFRARSLWLRGNPEGRNRSRKITVSKKSHNVTLMIAFMFIDDNYLGFGLVRETLSVSVCLPTESDKMQISSSCLTCVWSTQGKSRDNASSLLISCSLWHTKWALFWHPINWGLWEVCESPFDRVVWTERLQVLFFFRYPISVCISPELSCFSPHQLPVVPWSQPNKLRVINVGETLRASRRTMKATAREQSTAYFEHTVIFLLHPNLRVTGCWRLREKCCSHYYRLLTTSHFHCSLSNTHLFQELPNETQDVTVVDIYVFVVFYHQHVIHKNVKEWSCCINKWGVLDD